MNPIQNQNLQNQELTDTLRTQKKQKEELQASHDREMENLKKSYSAEKAEATDRFESSAQNDRIQHYENLRKIKNQINREEHDLESRGRSAISEKTLRFQKEAAMAEQEGRKRVDSTLKKYAALEEYERQATKLANDEAHDLRIRGTRQIIEESENGLEDLRKDKIGFLQDKKNAHSQAINEIGQHYDNLRKNQENQHQEELVSIEEKSFRDLNQKRLEHARLLSLQIEQKSDPFYQIQRFESKMVDEGPTYRLSIKVPEHERKGLRIQASGQDVQIIGTRVNDQEAFEQGRTISTRTHQTLSEKIKLGVPIDVNSITRIETDSGVEFKITKLGAASHKTPEPSPDTDRSNPRLAKNIRFSESLPSPTFLSPKSSKGTVG